MFGLRHVSVQLCPSTQHTCTQTYGYMYTYTYEVHEDRPFSEVGNMSVHIKLCLAVLSDPVLTGLWHHRPKACLGTSVADSRPLVEMSGLQPCALLTSKQLQICLF